MSVSKSGIREEADAEATDVGSGPTSAPGEVVLGVLSGISEEGRPLVNYPQAEAATVAVATVPVSREQVGRQVALLFAEGDRYRPVIMGFIHSPLHDLLESFTLDAPASGSEEDEVVFDLSSVNRPHKREGQAAETLEVDGERVVIEGKKEIVLQCGESSITLTKAGKIIIRGKYLISRSSGVNRILGGSVQVN